MTVSEAAASGDTKKLRALLEAGDDPNEAETEEHWPPLLEAACADHVEAARLLLDAGADMYAPHSGGETPLLMAGQRGSIGVFRLLLECGYQLDVERDNAAYVLTCGRHIEIVRFLLAQGVDVNSVDFQGCTALTYAASRSYGDTNSDKQSDSIAARLDMAEELIRAGADVNHRDEDGETVLMWAADKAGNGEGLRLLIANGADVNALNDEADALSWTMRHGDGEMIRLLLENGATVNLSDALVRATYKGFPIAARLLLEYGADPAALDFEGKSALEIALEKGYQDIAAMLLERLPNA